MIAKFKDSLLREFQKAHKKLDIYIKDWVDSIGVLDTDFDSKPRKRIRYRGWFYIILVAITLIALTLRHI